MKSSERNRERERKRKRERQRLVSKQHLPRTTKIPTTDSFIFSNKIWPIPTTSLFIIELK